MNEQLPLTISTQLVFKANRIISFMYTNNRGEREKRYVNPVSIEFADKMGPWYPEGWQYYLHAHDLVKDDSRTFALSSMEQVHIIKSRDVDTPLFNKIKEYALS